MKPEEFDYISGLLKQRSGLILSREKMYLLESRLSPIARRNGFETLDDLVIHIRRDRNEILIRTVVDAMTTNESFFFRDTTPFDLFRDHVLPKLRETNAASRRIRIWCAAASSGQEPYSLAIMLKDLEAQWSGWTFEILGTDINAQVLTKARAGIYSQFEVQRGLPIRMLIKYFTQEGETWQLAKSIRDMVTYKEFNLLESFRGLGAFDVIYCRNVLIYFDQATKSDVLNRMRDILPVHGTLFLGSAETVLGITERFKPVSGQRGMYITAEAPRPTISTSTAPASTSLGQASVAAPRPAAALSTDGFRSQAARR